MTDVEAIETAGDALDRYQGAEVCTVVTATLCHASPEAVWRGIMYYEQIPDRPPLLLRLLLPVPIRTVGEKSTVGDEALCEYVGGHLRKRVTEVEPARFYRFAVVEQALGVHGTRLMGGTYRIETRDDGRTELALETRYTGGRRPRWLWKPIEAAVCHAFHRHILRAMVRAIETTA